MTELENYSAIFPRWPKQRLRAILGGDPRHPGARRGRGSAAERERENKGRKGGGSSREEGVKGAGGRRCFGWDGRGGHPEPASRSCLHLTPPTTPCMPLPPSLFVARRSLIHGWWRPFCGSALGVDDACVEVIEQLLVYSPSDRLTCKEALVHPYFAGE